MNLTICKQFLITSLYYT